MGAYTEQDPKNGNRRHSYEAYPYTYEDIGNQGYEYHNDGEIWAATLWDLRKALGSAKTDKLVLNGLRATMCDPSMIDARDALLAADEATNNGANRARMWQVFATHGMGHSASGVEGDDFTGTICAWRLPISAVSSLG
jgi:extracellular elastinolytic metalloproteinase